MTGVVAARTKALLPSVLPPEPDTAVAALGNPSWLLEAAGEAVGVANEVMFTRALALGWTGVDVLERENGGAGGAALRDGE